MFNISLLCPTRNRPASLERMWESAMQTAKNPQKIELVLYIDDDDILSIEKAKQLSKRFGDQINVITGARDAEIYSNLHNICCLKSSSEIVMGSADDIIFKTKDWDHYILQIFNEIDDKIAFVYPDDGFNGIKLGTHGFFHKKWFDILGYLAPPIFTVDYSDNYIMDLAKGIGRCYFVRDVLVEHMHWTIGKSDFDMTAQEAHQRRGKTSNKEIYQSLDTKNKIKFDIQKLKAKIND